MYKIVFCLLLPMISRADLGSSYGFGSATAALAGSNRSFAYDGFALDRSPSLMSYLPTTNSYGFLVAKDFFEPIDNVQVDNEFIGGSSVTGNIDPDVPDTVSFLFGSVWSIGKSERHHRLGLTFSAPMDKITEPTTRSAYQPQYGGYLSDTQRLTLSAGLSTMLNQQWSIGLGVNYYFLQASTYQARMPPNGGSGRTSTSNLKMTVKPAIAPIAGLTWTDQYNYLTLYFAGSRDHKLKMRNDVSINILGGGTAVRFESETSLFYDPEVWSLGYANIGSSADILFAVDWERWSRFDGGYMKNSFDITTFSQSPVDMKFKDILIWKLGFNLKQATSSWKFGLSYRPSTHEIGHDSNNNSNFLDPDRWTAGLGYGWSSAFWGLLDEPLRIDTHIQGHYLVPKDIRKYDSTAIGWPGYKMGGYVLSYGINLSVGI